jgi:hypothetical protein
LIPNIEIKNPTAKNPNNSISSFQTCDTTTNPQSMHYLFLHTHHMLHIVVWADREGLDKGQKM